MDAEGRRHIVKDKAPRFTVQILDADSKYPTLGDIPVKVLERYQDRKGREWVRVNTESPSISSLGKVCLSSLFQRVW